MPDSFVKRLQSQFDEIEIKVIELINCSTIKRFDSEGLIIFAPDYYWGPTTDAQKNIQMEVRKTYNAWVEQFRLLFSQSTPEMQAQIDEAAKTLLNWIDKESGFELPSTTAEAVQVFKHSVRPFRILLQFAESTGSNEVVLVPDTNALIMAPEFADYKRVAGQDKCVVIIVPTVLSELDKLKVTHRDSDFRAKVNSVVNRIKGLRQQGSLLSGVVVHKTVSVKMVAKEPSFGGTLSWLDPANNDDRIIASSLEIQREYQNAVVILVTSDINLQNKAEMANLPFSEPPSS